MLRQFTICYTQHAPVCKTGALGRWRFDSFSAHCRLTGGQADSHKVGRSVRFRGLQLVNNIGMSSWERTQIPNLVDSVRITAFLLGRSEFRPSAFRIRLRRWSQMARQLSATQWKWVRFPPASLSSKHHSARPAARWPRFIGWFDVFRTWLMKCGMHHG